MNLTIEQQTDALGEAYGLLAHAYPPLNVTGLVSNAMIRPLLKLGHALHVCRCMNALDCTTLESVTDCLCCISDSYPDCLPIQLQSIWYGRYLYGLQGACSKSGSRVMRSCRAKLGLTQSKAAQAVGVLSQQYQTWELGLHSIPAVYIDKLAETLKCSPTDLYN